MKFARLFGGTAALCALIVAVLLFVRIPARGFDLQGSPVTIARPSTDITDTYLFPSPTNPNNVVAVMDVDPSIPAGAGLTTFFDQGVLYTMKFDTKYKEEPTATRPVEDVVIQFSVSAVTGPTGSQTQQISVYGPQAPVLLGSATKLLNSTATGTGFINREFSVFAGQVQVFAGARRDPQFFDKTQFFNIFPASTQAAGSASCLSSSCPSGFAAAGSNYFANSNVLSIVVEIPKSVLLNFGGGAGDGVAYWATTSTTTGN
jgi:Domain of unknown function (DUF4331)